MSTIEIEQVSAPKACAAGSEAAKTYTYSASSPPRQLSQRQLLIVFWLIPVVVLILWEALARYGWLEPHILPAPSKVLLTAFKLTVSGTLLNDLGVSLRRAATGFFIGGSIGFFLGTLVGFSRLGEAVIDRTVQMIRVIPFLAALPLVIVWFGVGEGQKIFLVALGVAFPIYINTTLGIRQVDPKLIELGRAQGLNSWQLIRCIILPGALPSILTGVRYALVMNGTKKSGEKRWACKPYNPKDLCRQHHCAQQE